MRLIGAEVFPAPPFIDKLGQIRVHIVGFLPDGRERAHHVEVQRNGNEHLIPEGGGGFGVKDAM